MSRYFVEGGSSYGPDIFARLDQGSRARDKRITNYRRDLTETPFELSMPTISTLLHDERGGHRLLAALILASLALGSLYAGKVISDNNAARAQVTAPVDLGPGITITDNPPAGTGGGEPPQKPPEISVVAPPTPDTASTAPSRDIEPNPPTPSRLIVPLKHISKGELVEWKTLQGTTRKMIGFKEADIPFLAPDNLQVTKIKINEPATFHGFEVDMFDPNKPNRHYILKGDLDIGDGLTLNVKRGTTITSSKNRGIENLGYKVLFYVLDVDQNTHIASDDEQTLRETFPAQLQGSPQTSSDYRGPDNPATNYVDTFPPQKN